VTAPGSMRRRAAMRALAAGASLFALPAAAQRGKPGRATAIVGGKVHLGAGAPLAEATVILVDGKVADVSKGAAAPAGAEVVDAKGLEVTPGLVDALTSVGLVEVDLEPSARDDRQGGASTIRAAFRASDGYNPASTVIAVTRAEGVTSVGVLPQGGLISGVSAFADLSGSTAAEALAEPRLALHVNLGAGALGTGGGHATAILRVREAFDDARTYARTRGAFERNQSRPFAPSRLDLEALASALDGKIPVVFHVERAADILSALSVAREFKLRPAIAGGAEAWRVAPALAKARVPVFVDVFGVVSSFEAIGAREDNAALLEKAGVPVALSTGSTHNARKLRQHAGNAVRSGMTHAGAIAAITRAPAEALGLGARYGTLAKGKVANVALWSGDPLELSTRVVGVWVRGERVSLRSRQTELFEKYRKVR
jgi:imidazolonepropionase-like amidohydrolase